MNCEILRRPILSSLIHDIFEEDQKKPHEQTFQVSNEKAKSLGVCFIPLEASLRDCIKSLKKEGLVSI